MRSLRLLATTRKTDDVGKIVALSLALVASTGCSLPKGSVALFRDGPPVEFAAKVEPLSPEWAGRLVRFSTSGTSLGGSGSHQHSIGHHHEASSKPSRQLDHPLGVRDVTADATHTHAVASFSTSPQSTTPAPSLPPSYGLDGRVVKARLIRRVPKSLIVGYLFETLPRGWVWCDGKNGTPDLRGRFVSLGPPLGPIGSEEHGHNANHSHVWSAAENKDKPAFVRDIATPQPPTIEATPRLHGHSVVSRQDEESDTNLAANRLPSLALRFIMATTEAESMPKGAVVAYSLRGEPWGWSSVEVRYGASLVDYFLRSVETGEQVGRVPGTTTHAHQIVSSHRLILEAPVSVGPTDSKRAAPVIPIASHAHEVDITGQFSTGAAVELPRFVAMSLIEKN